MVFGAQSYVQHGASMTDLKVDFNLPDISTPLVDRPTGLMAPEWYRFFEEFARQSDKIVPVVQSNIDGITGVSDQITALDAALVATQVDVATNTGDITALTVDIMVIDAVTIAAGNGLDGGGDIGSGDMTLDAKKDTGWTAGTGASAKGGYATYGGHVASAGYVQAEAQATDDAVKAVSLRLRAIEIALTANESIGP